MVNRNIRNGAMGWWLAVVLGLLSVGVAGGVTVRFAEDQYTVSAGETLQIPSLVELAAGEDGLFSYGVTLLLEGGDEDEVEFLGATVPGELDFNGPAGVGAFTVVAMGFAGIKGTIDSSQNPLEGYTGPAFAEFQVHFPVPGEYTFRSDFFNTLGPTEDIFVTTSGAVLDGAAIFDTVVVTVVPEPGVVAYLAFGWVLLRRRRS